MAKLSTLRDGLIMWLKRIRRSRNGLKAALNRKLELVMEADRDVKSGGINWYKGSIEFGNG